MTTLSQNQLTVIITLNEMISYGETTTMSELVHEITNVDTDEDFEVMTELEIDIALMELHSMSLLYVGKNTISLMDDVDYTEFF